MSEAPPKEGRAPAPMVKLAIEAGPLILFFLVNAKAGIFWATGVFMAAILVSLAASWRIERRLPPMALFTGVFVLVFGGLTIYLGDEDFIKIKLTVVNVLFAVLLGGGLALRKVFLKTLMGSNLKLTDEGWRKMTMRWIVFFLLMAALNEVLRRRLSTDDWVTFKAFGVLAGTVVFAFTLAPLIQRYQLPEDAPEDVPEDVPEDGA